MKLLNKTFIIFAVLISVGAAAHAESDHHNHKHAKNEKCEKTHIDNQVKQSPPPPSQAQLINKSKPESLTCGKSVEQKNKSALQQAIEITKQAPANPI